MVETTRCTQLGLQAVNFGGGSASIEEFASATSWWLVGNDGMEYRKVFGGYIGSTIGMHFPIPNYA